MTAVDPSSVYVTVASRRTSPPLAWLTVQISNPSLLPRMRRDWRRPSRVERAVITAVCPKTEKFVIPQLVMLKLKHKKATKAGMREMFGKMVKVAAKPAKKIVKAFPAKPLKDSI